ncbi:MAG TPA: hypothetical protein VMH20_18630 [Verrucomicrobiae bacterium]|nr:hypothetical protein [Verrucomicrobiae bacterium]
MRSGFRSAQLFFLALPIFKAASGGGGGTGGVQPPPPTPDFSIALSSSSLSLAQGSTSAPVNVSIGSQNNFAGSVQVSISGLPDGVSTNPVSPFSVPAGQSVALLIGAAFNAQTGQYTLTAQGTSGTLSHTQTLSLAIQAMPPNNLPRTRFVEDDFVTAVDSPLGQPHRRHIVYDGAHQRFYVARHCRTNESHRVFHERLAGGSAGIVQLRPYGFASTA